MNRQRVNEEAAEHPQGSFLEYEQLNNLEIPN